MLRRRILTANEETLLSVAMTPFTPRHAQLNKSSTWSDWMNGVNVYVRPAEFGNHEAAVTTMRQRAVLEDKSPLSMYFFSGPDAAALLQRLVIRDVDAF